MGSSDPGYLSYVAPQAYACYTAENTTLTFYHDYYRSGRTGTTYGLNDSAIEPGWANDGTNSKVTKVAFDPSFAEVRPTFTCYWFYEMRKLETITGMDYLNTSEAQTNPTGPATSTYRVSRGGGSWSQEEKCRVSSREAIEPSYCGCGLRLAL